MVVTRGQAYILISAVYLVAATTTDSTWAGFVFALVALYWAVIGSVVMYREARR